MMIIIKIILTLLILILPVNSYFIKHTLSRGNGYTGGCPNSPICGPGSNGSLGFGIYTNQGALMKEYTFNISSACGYALYVWADTPSYPITLSGQYRGEHYTGVNHILICPTDLSPITITAYGYANTDIIWRSYSAHMNYYSTGVGTLNFTPTISQGALTLFTGTNCFPSVSSPYIITNQIYASTQFRSSLVWNFSVQSSNITINLGTGCAYTAYIDTPLVVKPYLDALSLDCNGNITPLNIIGRYYDVIAVAIPLSMDDPLCKLFTHWVVNDTYLEFTTLSLTKIRNMNIDNRERYWYGRWNISLSEIDNHLDMRSIYAWDSVLSISNNTSAILYEQPCIGCSICAETATANILRAFNLPRLVSIPNILYTCEELVMGNDGLGLICNRNIDCITNSGVCNMSINRCVTTGVMRDNLLVACIVNRSENILSYSYINITLTQSWLSKYNLTSKSELTTYLISQHRATIIEGPDRTLYMNHKVNLKQDPMCIDTSFQYVISFSGGIMNTGCKRVIISRSASVLPTNRSMYKIENNRLDIYKLYETLYSVNYLERTGAVNALIERNIVPSREYLIATEYCSGGQPSEYLPIWRFDVDQQKDILVWNVYGEVAATEYFDQSVLFTSLNRSTTYRVCDSTSCNFYSRDTIKTTQNRTDTRCKACIGTRPAFGWCPSIGGTWLTQRKTVLTNVTSVISNDVNDTIGILLTESVLIVEGKYNTSSTMKLDNSSIIVDKDFIMQSTAEIYMVGKSNVSIGNDLIIFQTSSNINTLSSSLPVSNIILTGNSSLTVGGNILAYERATIIMSNQSTLSVNGISNNTIQLNASTHSPGLIITGLTDNIMKYDISLPINTTQSCYSITYKNKSNRTSIWLISSDECEHAALLPIIIAVVGIIIVLSLGIVLVIFRNRNIHNKVFPFYETGKTKKLNRREEILNKHGFNTNNTTNIKGRIYPRIPPV